MTQDTEFTKFVALVDVNEEVQNVQEMASVWGDVRQEFEAVGAEIDESYAVLGEFDFLIAFEGPSTETAFKTDVILERHGLDVRTMAVTDTADFAELVRDV
ncbi:MAG: GYD domain-containing protein [Haloferacaceae archaeon]